MGDVWFVGGKSDGHIIASRFYRRECGSLYVVHGDDVRIAMHGQSFVGGARGEGGKVV